MEEYYASITGSENGYDYVDLGLSVNWAFTNIGANKPDARGIYFAWGETSTKDDYSWRTYKYIEVNSLTKYNTREQYGYCDGLSKLLPEDDAAHVNWGGKWRMPTLKEWKELEEFCKIEGVYSDAQENDIVGKKIIGANGNCIFLPYTGQRSGTEWNDGLVWSYWTSNLYSEYDDAAVAAWAYQQHFFIYVDEWRYCGCPIRPVCPR